MRLPLADQHSLGGNRIWTMIYNPIDNKHFHSSPKNTGEISRFVECEKKNT